MWMWKENMRRREWGPAAYLTTRTTNQDGSRGGREGEVEPCQDQDQDKDHNQDQDGPRGWGEGGRKVLLPRHHRLHQAGWGADAAPRARWVLSSFYLFTPLETKNKWKGKREISWLLNIFFFLLQLEEFNQPIFLCVLRTTSSFHTSFHIDL